MKTTAEKIAVMQAAKDASFASVQMIRQDEEGDYAGDWRNVEGEPLWDWCRYDYRIKPPEPKTKEVTVWAHWIEPMSDLFTKDVFFEHDDMSKSTSYASFKLLAVKPITFTITEGEGLDKA